MSYVNIVDRPDDIFEMPKGWLDLHFFRQHNFDENMKGNSKLLITCNVWLLFALLIFVVVRITPITQTMLLKIDFIARLTNFM